MSNRSNNNKGNFLRYTLKEVGMSDTVMLIEWQRLAVRYAATGSSARYFPLLPYIQDLNEDIDEAPRIEEAANPLLTAEGVQAVYQSLVIAANNKRRERATLKRAFFTVMMGQVGGQLLSSLLALDGFTTRQTTGDIIWLWRKIEELVSGAHVGRNWPANVILRTVIRIACTKQGPTESIEDYHLRFSTEVEGAANAGIDLSDWTNDLFANIRGNGEGVLVAAWINGLRAEYSGYRNTLHNNYVSHLFS